MTVRLGPADVTPQLLEAVREGAVVAPADVAILELAGPGAVTCFQGLLTNDIETPGDGAFVYGALLTPKGMIVVDGWAARLGAAVRFAVPVFARERTLETLTRWVPPRLARASDRTPERSALRLVGPRAGGIVQGLGFPVPPQPARVLEATIDGAPYEIARAPDGAPFALQLTGPAAECAKLAVRAAAAGAVRAHVHHLELPRILTGWPSLAAEVDDKTIPQEVRFDEIGGVSYTKGCYTGQETVSRLHFRGHANRHLRGLEFDAEPPADEAIPVRHGEREVGRVTSVTWVPDEGRWVGLAVLRREVTPGMVVRAGAVDARVVELPFSFARPTPA